MYRRRHQTPAARKQAEKFRTMVQHNTSRMRYWRQRDKRRQARAVQSWVLVGLAAVGLVVAWLVYMHR